MSASTVLFVGGSQRSGTSITQQLLCQLPEANPYVYECSFLRQQVELYRSVRSPFSPNDQCYFGSVQQLHNFCAGVVHAFLDQARISLGRPKHLILKEPALTMHWPWLAELIPDAVFLLVVRDPRDIVASMLSVGKKQRELGQDAGLAGQQDVDALSRYVLSFYVPVLNYEIPSFRRRLGIMKYEDLMTDPEATLGDVAGFTGLPFNQIDLNAPLDSGYVSQEKVRTSDHLSPWATEVYGKQISASRIGRHRTQLSPEQISVVEEVCADFMSCFSYQPTAARTAG